MIDISENMCYILLNKREAAASSYLEKAITCLQIKRLKGVLRE